MTDLTVHDTDTPDTTHTPAADTPAADTPAAATRRDTLRNGLVAAGLAAAAIGGTRTRSGTPTPQPGVHTLTLTATDLYTDADGTLQPGHPANAYADLHDPHGVNAGRFYATLTPIDHTDDDTTLAQETHTFVLRDATLIGAGVSSIDDDQPDTYAIIGGTGRYLGARGQYTATQHHTDLGGDGTATYDMTIIVDTLTDKGN